MSNQAEMLKAGVLKTIERCGVCEVDYRTLEEVFPEIPAPHPIEIFADTLYVREGGRSTLTDRKTQQELIAGFCAANGLESFVVFASGNVRFRKVRVMATKEKAGRPFLGGDRIAITVYPKQKARLDQMAKEQYTNRTDLIRRAIDEMLERERAK